MYNKHLDILHLGIIFQYEPPLFTLAWNYKCFQLKILLLFSSVFLQFLVLLRWRVREQADVSDRRQRGTAAAAEFGRSKGRPPAMICPIYFCCGFKLFCFLRAPLMPLVLWHKCHLFHIYRFVFIDFQRQVAQSQSDPRRVQSTLWLVVGHSFRRPHGQTLGSKKHQRQEKFCPWPSSRESRQLR